MTLTRRRLFFVHEVERVPSRSMDQIQGLSHLGKRPSKTFGVADSVGGLQSDSLV